MLKAVSPEAAPLAEIELDAIRDNWLDSRERAIKRGAYIGEVPLGYDRGFAESVDDGECERSVVEQRGDGVRVGRRVGPHVHKPFDDVSSRENGPALKERSAQHVRYQRHARQR